MYCRYCYFKNHPNSNMGGKFQFFQDPTRQPLHKVWGFCEAKAQWVHRCVYKLRIHSTYVPWTHSFSALLSEAPPQTASSLHWRGMCRSFSPSPGCPWTGWTGQDGLPRTDGSWPCSWPPGLLVPSSSSWTVQCPNSTRQWKQTLYNKLAYYAVMRWCYTIHTYV